MNARSQIFRAAVLNGWQAAAPIVPVAVGKAVAIVSAALRRDGQGIGMYFDPNGRLLHAFLYTDIHGPGRVTGDVARVLEALA